VPVPIDLWRKLQDDRLDLSALIYFSRNVLGIQRGNIVGYLSQQVRLLGGNVRVGRLTAPDRTSRFVLLPELAHQSFISLIFHSMSRLGRDLRLRPRSPALRAAAKSLVGRPVHAETLASLCLHLCSHEF